MTVSDKLGEKPYASSPAKFSSKSTVEKPTPTYCSIKR